MPPSADGPDAPPGHVLGDFRLVREIGRGGMGVVYEAEQLSLGRRVALKVLPPAAALDARRLRRFENEARAAALLHHGNVVPLYAVGCEEGVHFFVMQLINGVTLAQLLHNRDDSATPRDGPATAPSLSPATPDTRPSESAPLLSLAGPGSERHRAVARAGAAIADALDHAHNHGVI